MATTSPCSSAQDQPYDSWPTGESCDRTRVSLQLQWGLSTWIAAVSHDSPCELTAAVGILHRDCSCRPRLTWPTSSARAGRLSQLVSAVSVKLLQRSRDQRDEMLGARLGSVGHLFGAAVRRTCRGRSSGSLAAPEGKCVLETSQTKRVLKQKGGVLKQKGGVLEQKGGVSEQKGGVLEQKGGVLGTRNPAFPAVSPPPTTATVSGSSSQDTATCNTACAEHVSAHSCSRDSPQGLQLQAMTARLRRAELCPAVEHADGQPQPGGGVA